MDEKNNDYNKPDLEGSENDESTNKKKEIKENDPYKSKKILLLFYFHRLS